MKQAKFYLSLFALAVFSTLFFASSALAQKSDCEKCQESQDKGTAIDCRHYCDKREDKKDSDKKDSDKSKDKPKDKPNEFAVLFPMSQQINAVNFIATAFPKLANQDSDGCGLKIFDETLNFEPFDLSSLITPSAQTNWTDCVSVYDVKRGNNCGSRTSLEMKIKNRCTQNIDMKFCIQRENGTWDCGMWTNTAPNESTSTYTCKSNGIYCSPLRQS